MGGLSIWHWLVVLVIVVVLFGGGGKISTVMGDFASGLKSFKKTMAEDARPVTSAEPVADSITASDQAAVAPREKARVA